MWTAFRKAIFWIHLSLGLVAALVLGVMCVTGALLTYERQTIYWYDRNGLHSTPPAPGARPLTVEALIHKVREDRGVAPETVTFFVYPAAPVQVRLKKIGSPYVDAYTGVVIGNESRGIRKIFAAIVGWHTALGFAGAGGKQGHEVVAAVNLIFVFLALLGVFLWIPRQWTWRHLRAILFFRTGLPGHARDFNWHNVIGVWSLVPLLIIAWTGVAMSYRWARDATIRAMGPQTQEWRGAQPVPAPGTMTLDDLLQRAKSKEPGWKSITLKVPPNDTAPVDFAIDRSGYNGIGQSSGLQLDRAGNVVVFTRAGSGPMPAQTFIRFGHTGEAWGGAGQTIAGLASLGAAVLAWTGVALSLRRFSAWRRRRAH